MTQSSGVVVTWAQRLVTSIPNLQGFCLIYRHHLKERGFGSPPWLILKDQREALLAYSRPSFSQQPIRILSSILLFQHFLELLYFWGLPALGVRSRCSPSFPGEVRLPLIPHFLMASCAVSSSLNEESLTLALPFKMSLFGLRVAPSKGSTLDAGVLRSIDLRVFLF